MTPLIHATMKGHKEVVSYLLEKGANINESTNEGFTPLMGAAKFGSLEIVTILADKGASIHATKTGKDSGWTPLMFAAWQGKKDVVEMLLLRGAKIDACTTESLWTPLLFAIQEGHDETAQFLIEKGATIHVQDHEHFTPLMCAAKFGRPIIAQILIERGANVNATKIGEGEGWTPLMFAAWQGKTEAAKLLLKHGADVNSKTVSGWTAIMWAAREGYDEIVSLLIEKGAQINQKANKGYNALGLAALNGYLPIVQHLVEAGANITAKDEETGTPLDSARLKKHEEIVKYLRAHGAKDATPAKPSAVPLSGFPSNPSACLSIILRDSKTMGNAGPGGTAFSNAIQALNNGNNPQAETYFKQALQQGLDPLRQGYAHANLGILSIKQNNLASAIDEFITILNSKEALHESVHDAVQYLSIIYDVLGKPALAAPLQQLFSKTMSALNYKLSPEAVAQVRELAELHELELLEKEETLREAGIVPDSPTFSKEKIKQHIKQKGLRPFGNKKRLLFQEGQSCYAYMALFGEKQKLERYYKTYIEYAEKNPPPLPIEVMMAYAPKNIHAQKFAFVYPYTGSGVNPDYQAWAREAILACNDVVRQDTYLAGDYSSIPSNIEVVLDWDILLPAGLSLDIPEADEIFSDPPDCGFRIMKVQGEGESTVPEKPNPQGSWIGILFEIDKFEEALYGRAAIKLFLQLVGAQNAASTIIHGGDILPDCRYWCTAVRTTSSGQAQIIINAITNANEIHLAPPGSRILEGSAVPISTLPYQGFISSNGTYVGS